MQRAFITGGTGTVGKELVKQLYGTSEIVVFSRNEVAQVEMSRQYPDIKYIIGDIRDRRALKESIQPGDRIYHLAAIKHITICDKQPHEAILTNVFGTENIVKIAKRKNCELVFLSSDKAEEPTCIYGSTKLIGERIVLAAGFAVVRSGNIFGSSGSVIPLWIKQLNETNTIYLTDKNMTRFFINVSDLVGYIIISKNGIFIPHTSSFKMIDLATYIIAKYGNLDSIISIIGVRQGEKLHEKLDGISSEDCIGSYEQLKSLFNDN